MNKKIVLGCQWYSRAIDNLYRLLVKHKTNFLISLTLVSAVVFFTWSYSKYLERYRNLGATPDDYSRQVILRSYKIITDVPFLTYKRSIDVRINKKLSVAELTTLAKEIKASDPNEYDQIFIAYYLPGMEIDKGSWASTHYRPHLEVKIYGIRK